MAQADAQKHEKVFHGGSIKERLTYSEGEENQPAPGTQSCFNLLSLLFSSGRTHTHMPSIQVHTVLFMCLHRKVHTVSRGVFHLQSTCLCGAVSRQPLTMKDKNNHLCLPTRAFIYFLISQLLGLTFSASMYNKFSDSENCHITWWF